MKLLIRAAWALALLPGAALAQPSFVEVTPTADPWFVTPPEEDFWINAVAPADVDGDGDLDLAVLGFYVVYNVSAEDFLIVFLNQGPDGGGAWTFAPQIVPLGALTAGASDLAWGDFDGDGDPDLAVGSDGVTAVYRNDAGVLAPLVDDLPGYWEDSGYTGAYDLRSLAWADADNDGDLDLLVPSVFDFVLFQYRTALLRNDGDDGAGGWLFAEVAATGLDPTVHAQSAWGDDDGDGDLDLFLTNVDPYTGTGFVRRYGNDAGTFTGGDLLPLRVEYGLADRSDFDGDGDLDVLVAGNIEEGGTYSTVLRVYENDAGTLTATTLVEAPNADWLDLHAATWADYDSDGDVDILVTGNHVVPGEIVGKSEVFANDGGVFTPLGVTLPAPISSVGRGGSFTWLDLDGDDDLDYLVAGAYYVQGGNGLVEAKIQLFRNDTPAANQPPGAPAGLVATTGPGSLALSWTAAPDDHTPGASLTYELELRPAGAPPGTGRRLPEPGNLSSALAWEIAGLAPGSYLCSVRAVDSAFAGGERAATVVSVPAALLFGDGFESGDTGAWSGTVP